MEGTEDGFVFKQLLRIRLDDRETTDKCIPTLRLWNNFAGDAELGRLCRTTSEIYGTVYFEVIKPSEIANGVEH